MYGQHIQAGRGHYAYGWTVNDWKVNEQTKQVIGHSGGINGFNTIIQRVPEDGTVVILLNNTGGAQLDKISLNIAAILYDLDYELPKRSLALGLLQQINKNGLEQAILWYNETKDEGTYALNEGEMNNVGYNLLSQKQIKAAIAVFTINVKEFPKSSNTYDSLGEAYLADGNNTLALKNYKKAFELDPTNKNAEKIVKKLDRK